MATADPPERQDVEFKISLPSVWVPDTTLKVTVGPGLPESCIKEALKQLQAGVDAWARVRRFFAGCVVAVVALFLAWQGRADFRAWLPPGAGFADRVAAPLLADDPLLLRERATLVAHCASALQTVVGPIGDRAKNIEAAASAASTGTAARAASAVPPSTTFHAEMVLRLGACRFADAP